MRLMKPLLITLAIWVAAAPAWSAPTADYSCVADLIRRLSAERTHHEPNYVGTEARERPALLVMSESQNEVPEPEKIELFKRLMREGQFRYESLEGRIGGFYHERRRLFLVGEGHHRLAAALEIAREEGDWRPFRQLIRHGLWEITDKYPARACRLPVRAGWGDYFAWRRFLEPLMPGR